VVLDVNMGDLFSSFVNFKGDLFLSFFSLNLLVNKFFHKKKKKFELKYN
jgi:hypothetical protein